MFNITYAPDDASIAERMQQDLSALGEKMDANILIVLVSPASVQDNSVIKAIQTAVSQRHIVVPIILQPATLPEAITHVKAVDLTAGYNFKTIKTALRQASGGQTTRRRNTIIGTILLVLVMLSFTASVIGLAGGYIGVPLDEFSTEAAIQNGMIETLIFPTLDPLMPRTTQDAENFPMTVEAANTRNAPLLMMTATALPRNQQATQAAFMTIEAATSTARAEATSEAED